MNISGSPGIVTITLAVEEAKGVEVNEGDRELVITISDPSEVRTQLDEVIEEELARWGKVR